MFHLIQMFHQYCLQMFHLCLQMRYPLLKAFHSCVTEMDGSIHDPFLLNGNWDMKMSQDTELSFLGGEDPT